MFKNIEILFVLLTFSKVALLGAMSSKGAKGKGRDTVDDEEQKKEVLGVFYGSFLSSFVRKVQKNFHLFKEAFKNI